MNLILIYTHYTALKEWEECNSLRPVLPAVLVKKMTSVYKFKYSERRITLKTR